MTCASDPASSSDSGSDERTTCVEPADPASVFGSVTVTQNEDVVTVFRVDWTPGMDGQSGMKMGLPGDIARDVVTRENGDGSVTALWWGLQASTVYEGQLILETDAQSYCSAPISVETGELPSELPDVSFSLEQPEAAAGGFTLMPVNSDDPNLSYQLVLDEEGQVVWYWKAGTLRTRLSLDGQAIWFNDRTYDAETMASIERVPLDGSDSTQYQAMGLHTDFVEVEPGVIASFGWDVQDSEETGQQIAGETIVEVHADGSVREVWNLFDHLDPADSSMGAGSLPCCPDAQIWAHLNHLHYDRNEDAYYATARNLDAVFKVDRSSGDLVWMLSGEQSSFDVAEGSEPAWFDPHSAVPTEEGVLIYDTVSPLTNGCTGLSEFALDEANWTVAHLNIYTTEDCQQSHFMGNAEELWNGNRTLVVAMTAQVDEVTADGDLVARWNAPLGTWLGFTSRLPDLGPIDSPERGP